MKIDHLLIQKFLPKKNDMFSLRKIFAVSIVTFSTLGVNANEAPKIKLATELSSCQYSISSFETTTTSKADPIQIRFGREISYVDSRSATSTPTTGTQVKETVKTVFNGLSFSMTALVKERDIEFEIKAENADVVMRTFTSDGLSIQGPDIKIAALHRKLVIPDGKSVTIPFGYCALTVSAKIIVAE